MLSKIFSREKGVWYAYVWDESDRLGFRKYLKHEVKYNLFIRKNKKLSVWYDNTETTIIHKKIRENFLHYKNFATGLFKDLNYEWGFISLYIEHGQYIKSANELQNYYNHLVRWWAAMAILFRLDLPEELAQTALDYRRKAEKFSDKMVEVWDQFWKQKHKDFLEIINLVTPNEAFSLERLSPQEIISIKSRENGVALFNGSLNPLSHLENILKENNLEIEEEKNLSATLEFKGKVAYKGKVQGRARLILLSKHISTMKKGEVLVTEMTSPDYLPAIKKAAAIVTDEGGVTCHAAIVSRELGIPCVVGTKIATQVLKSGDFIEVDANKGIIRKLG